MDIDLLMSTPEELEREGYQRIKEGKIKDGVKMLVRAAKGYEEKRDIQKAASLYKEAGALLRDKLGLYEQAKPLMLRAAYLYLKVIEGEIDKPEVNLERLTNSCLNVIEAFTFLGDQEHVRKYAEEFAKMYEDLGSNYEEAGEIESAIVAYESAYRYYDLLNNKEGVERIAGRLVEIYGKIAEDAIENEMYEESAEAFERVANYIKTIFGYDERYRELMETAGKHYEKASKLAYAEGDLETMTRLLLKAQYAYLLARNFNRANLIGVNLIKMLNQVIENYRSSGRFDVVGDKLIELAEALVGLGKFENAMKIYREALEETGGRIDIRARIRISTIKYIAAKEMSLDLLRVLDAIDFLMKHAKFLDAMELAEEAIRKYEEGEKILKFMYQAEGVR
ncbi:hypothetical protein A3L04_00125 [Thermococcus chitonophagus]|uniref:Gamma-soluble NSF attachment protein n=1 Tax=Thermococcus chitonophagus TaxID=54262 RepID=A0A160VQM4_9EURY|nr:hypothetical protein [Thermococcus chitonophagus]ASJ15591.1 hypothetical protein A3L04_00125 [Thermococcus chitonophagus]CUX76799.1 hypothetical protein CHITON_0020 [Thermococcus chitonophagus]